MRRVHSSIVLIQRGGCTFDEKVTHVHGAYALAVFNRDDQPGRTTTISAGAAPMPLLFLAKEDGHLLREYLLRRRDWWSGRVGSQASYSSPLLGTVVATNATHPEDVAALRAVASSLQLSWEAYATLRPWSQLVTTALDPCLDRVMGVYCERGRVVALSQGTWGASGELHSAIGQLRYLRYLDVTFGATDGAGVMGGLPDSVCQLKELRSLTLDDNFLTTLPDCLGFCEKLQVLSVSQNQLQSLPTSIGSAPLVYLDASANRLTGLPASFWHAHHLVYANVQNNPHMMLRASEVRLASWQRIRTLRMGSMNMRGELASGALDGLTKLEIVELANNELTGPLPHLVNCTSLKELRMFGNAFTGDIPDAWSGMQSITLLELQRNALNGSLVPLRRLSQLRLLDVSRNLLRLAPSSTHPEVGYFFSLVLPPLISEVYFDHNQLDGPFGRGYFGSTPNWRLLSIAHNQLRSLPDDLFAADAPLIHLDASYNRLDGFFPGSYPRTTTLVGNPPFQLLDIRGNSGFFSGSPPTWMSTGAGELVVETNVHALCPRWISGQSDRMQLHLDPTFTLFRGCSCTSGFFGRPPWCYPIPLAVRLTADGPPSSADVDALITQHLQTPTTSQLPAPVWAERTEVTYFDQLLGTRVDGDTWNSSSRQPAQLPSDASLSVHRPPSFTDRWFSQAVPTDLLVPISVSYNVELRSLRKDRVSSVELRNKPLADAATIDPAARLQPVRTIQLSLYISRASFMEADTLRISTSRAIMQDITRASLSDLPLVSTPPVGYNLSALVQPVLVSVRVAGNEVSVSFQGLQSTRVRFVGLFSYSFDCPAGLTLLQADRGTQCLHNRSNVYVPSRNGSYAFECLGLTDGEADVLQALADPASVQYSGCRCGNGTFGVPPFCSLVPSSATVSPYGEPVSYEVGAQPFAYMTAWQQVTPSSPHANATAALNDTLGVHPRVERPYAISDAWYGDRRYQPGFSTTWTIDLLSVRHRNSSHHSVASDVVSYELARPDTEVPAGDPLQPVRYIRLRIHVDRTRFMQVSTWLAIYQGVRRQAVAPVWLLTGADGRLDRCESASADTFSAHYQSAYGSLLTQLESPCEFSTVVRGNVASVEFGSRAQAHRHFVVTYSFFFVCPDGEILDMHNRCSVPVESALVVLPYALGAAGVLLALLFVWMLRERWLRQRSKEDRSRRLSGMDELDLGTPNQSAESMRTALSTRQKAELRLQLLRSGISLLAEVGSCCSNWVDVARIVPLIGSGVFSAKEDRINVAFVLVIIVSTLAFLVNACTRVWMMSQSRDALHLLQHRAANFEETRWELRVLEFSIRTVQITSLTILFDSLPVSALNIIKTVYEQSDRTQLRSLVWSLLLTGWKLSQWAGISRLKMDRLRLQCQLVLRKMEQLREQAAAAHVSIKSSTDHCSDPVPARATSPALGVPTDAVAVSPSRVILHMPTTSLPCPPSNLVKRTASLADSAELLSVSRPVSSVSPTQQRTFRVFRREESCPRCMEIHQREHREPSPSSLSSPSRLALSPIRHQATAVCAQLISPNFGAIPSARE